ncbi:MAG: hypothetical protein B6U97_04175 [Candidatus Altiarchaeales archaeon ex4484_96]|nr:MAG: hypothetical protein B6U97_04175 [Candidatus Altiarchaeales archaeon ex4484_96]
METTVFYITLSAVILLLSTALVLPAYGDWMKLMDGKKAIQETKKVVSAVESISSLGDVGSTQQLKLNMPPGYSIQVNNHSINLMKKDKIINKNSLTHLELIYHGSQYPAGKINLSVTHWIRDENFSEKKEYLIEVIP